jgi:cytochrome P450
MAADEEERLLDSELISQITCVLVADYTSGPNIEEYNTMIFAASDTTSAALPWLASFIYLDRIRTPR